MGGPARLSWRFWHSPAQAHTEPFVHSVSKVCIHTSVVLELLRLASWLTDVYFHDVLWLQRRGVPALAEVQLSECDNVKDSDVLTLQQRYVNTVFRF